MKSSPMPGPRIIRPTLIIGYGKFGGDVMRRLLSHSALRGVLRWRPVGGGGEGMRRLENLGLYWVCAEADRNPESGLVQGAGTEALRDLMDQIQVTRDLGNFERMVGEVEAMVKLLISAAERSTARKTGPLGLDVVVVGRIAEVGDIGFLKRLVTEILDRLGTMEALMHGLGQGRRLNLVQVLDWEDYWQPSDEKARIREALIAAVAYWEERGRAGQLGCDRIYLSNSDTEDGHRDEPMRTDEASAFLELLVFEAQRATDLHKLFYSGDGRNPIATFGIRIFDWSAVLLSRLAAGCFAIRWLDYLSGEGWEGYQRPARALAQALEPYGAATLDRLVDATAFREAVDTAMDRLAAQLLEVDPKRDQEQWLREITRRVDRYLDDLETTLKGLAEQKLQVLHREHLTKLAEHLRTAIDADLHDPDRPSSLKGVLAQVESARTGLGTPLDEVGADPAPAGETQRFSARLRGVQSRYRELLAHRVNVTRLRYWWWLFASVMAVALTPPALAALDQRGLALGPGAPLAAITVLFLLGLLLGRGLLHQRVAFRAKRAEDYYLNPIQGRFAGLLRRALAPHGDVRACAEALVRRIVADLKLSVRAEASREMGRIVARLGRRSKELHWLRGQLAAFLKWQGVELDEGNRPRSYGATREDASTVRTQRKRLSDIKEILDLNPPEEDRFRSAQGEHRPFLDWTETYSSAFLDPFALLDRIGSEYERLNRDRDGGLADARARERQARDFAVEVARRETFGPAFSWRQQSGVPPLDNFCIVPPVWKEVPEVRLALNDWGLDGTRIFAGSDPSRAYLVQVLLGVEREALRSGS